MVATWAHFDHMADMGISGIADTQAGAFEQVALALTAVVVPPNKLCPTETVSLYCQDTDREMLLYDWLNAVIYEMATRRMLFGRYEVQIDGNELRAMLFGEPVDRLTHQPTVEVKGATFTELKLFQTIQGRWVAQCVVDV